MTTPNSPPIIHVDGMAINLTNCKTILAELGMAVHPYKDRDKYCNSKQQSDHIIQNACFENSRGGGGISSCPKYNLDEAPCVCLNDKTRVTTQHGKKTLAQNEWTTKQKDAGKKSVTYKEARDANLEAMKKAKPELENNTGAMECLKLIVDDHFKNKLGLEDDSPIRVPRTGKFRKPAPKALLRRK